jgi:hypothetical protein
MEPGGDANEVRLCTSGIIMAGFTRYKYSE